ncbi:MAG: biotin--[acetyl-CoA-carboxylase] ligase [Gemmatimonadetes bacterium 21-71-4]|nr:MAG: biotin--[acetyl-CoA-carboxylase] ligase [Gemmatimonadetes bacterium 21-71-4]
MPTRSGNPAFEGPPAEFRYDGHSAAALAMLLGVPGVELLRSVASTLDRAHELAAAGAPAGTLVLADMQTAGRGRQGRRWHSEPGRGIWLTLIERPDDAAALDVLSLRVGLYAARALDEVAPAKIRLKWPNDLFVRDAKLAGVLVEARWREGAVDWVAIGVGLNVRAPTLMPTAAALQPGMTRLSALGRLVPALRDAARRTGPLDSAELAAFAERDLARRRRCREPLTGTVAGIDPSGALIVNTPRGLRTARTGSLVFQEDL